MTAIGLNGVSATRILRSQELQNRWPGISARQLDDHVSCMITADKAGWAEGNLPDDHDEAGPANAWLTVFESGLQDVPCARAHVMCCEVW